MNSHRQTLVICLAASTLVAGCTGQSDPPDAPSKASSVPTIVGRWDLLTLDHRSLPVEVYRSPTGETASVVEGHLILEADGTYRRWTVTQGGARRDSVIFVSSYVLQATPTPTLTLRIDAGNQGVGVFADGTLSVTYTDFLDWWAESWRHAP